MELREGGVLHCFKGMKLFLTVNVVKGSPTNKFLLAPEKHAASQHHLQQCSCLVMYSYIVVSTQWSLLSACLRHQLIYLPASAPACPHSPSLQGQDQSLLFLPTTFGQMLLERLWQRSSSCGHSGQCLLSQPLVWRGQSDGEQRFGASLERRAAKVASGYPALFYGKIPYLLVYAAAGMHIQFGRLLPLGQV